VVLSPEEVLRFFESVLNLRHRAALMICYGAGLRISEAVALKVSDIDSSRMLIRVEQGKGRKDRYVMLSPRLLRVLRCYARTAKLRKFLFPSWNDTRHLSCGALAQACRDAARRSGIGKAITAHTLRHYAEFRTMPSKSQLLPRQPGMKGVAKAELVCGLGIVRRTATGS
jgi:integrase